MKKKGLHVKIVIFGDSITNGYNSETGLSRPILKAQIESQAATLKAFQQNPLMVNLQGVNGDITPNALLRLDRVLAQKADAVLIFFGANDSAKHRGVSKLDFEQNLRQMIQQIGPERVILLTPPYHDDRYDKLRRSNAQVQAYGQVTKQLAETFQLPLIDVFAAMAANQPLDWLQADGLHFSEIGYQNLATLIVRSLEKLK